MGHVISLKFILWLVKILIDELVTWFGIANETRGEERAGGKNFFFPVTKLPFKKFPGRI